MSEHRNPARHHPKISGPAIRLGRPRCLTLAISGALALGMQTDANAQLFSGISLGNLDGSDGFVLNGEAEGNRSGISVSAAGDINGDGIDDVIIGGDPAPSSGDRSGRSYVVFGSAAGFPNVFNLSDTNGLNGFVLEGEAPGDRSGFSVSAAGDINGDGVDDLIIGAPFADPNGNQSGRGYVVFGSASGLPNPFNLSSLNGLNGFVLDGEAQSDLSGISVSVAGDINGDSIDDLIIGAHFADPNGDASSGRSYVVFGSASGLPNPFNLSSLNGSNGFVINGEAAFDLSGRSVSVAGDINGDGIDDLIIGAPLADPNGDGSGRSYVVFGSASELPNPFHLSSLNGLNGFVLDGVAPGDSSGNSVSAAGDVNGDGIDDLIIGAPMAGDGYVVFGSTSAFGNPFDLADLDGMNGFTITGFSSDQLGRSVSAAGDINGDGIDDVIIGAPLEGDFLSQDRGRSYVIFGSIEGFPDNLSVLSIDGVNGFSLVGPDEGERSGESVSSAGDINGDGIDDLIIGAPFAAPNGSSNAGRSYVVFGRSDRLFSDRFEND